MSAAERFGTLLRAHRHSARWTIEELSDRSGISIRAIGDMELGRSRRPHRRTVQALVAALDLTPQQGDALVSASRSVRLMTPAPVAGGGELPRDMWDFTGRDTELARLRGLAEAADDEATPAPVVVVSGAPGSGKTTLVVHAADAMSGRFADGRLFADLRGMDAAPISSHEALARLLRALGSPETDIPADVAERAGLYRSLLRERRCLIVLDNAADEAQVRPLLPGGGRSLVVITSRRALAGLEGVHHLPLTEMPPEDAVDFLDKIIRSGREAARTEDLEDLARLCGNLPLALRIAGSRLLSRPTWNVEQLTGRLMDEERRLAALSAGDLRVGAAFALSYRQLSARGRRTFRLLALVPGPSLGVSLGAALALSGLEEAEDTLEELVDLGLLQHTSSGERYRFHDLVRLYARERLNDDESERARRAARERMVDWLLRTATFAGRWFEPDHELVLSDASGLADIATPEQADAWLRAESANWLIALRAAAEAGRHAQVIDVAEAMHWFSDRWMYWGHWHEVFALSSDSARASGDPRAEVVHLNYLAWALSACESRHGDSIDVALQAFALARATGDVDQQGWALTYASWAARDLPDLERAAGYAAEAAALFQMSGDKGGYPQAKAILGDCLRNLGRPDEALRHHRELLAVLRDPEYGAASNITEMSVGMTLSRIGRDLAAMGRPQEAVGHFLQALPLLRRHHLSFGITTVLHDLGRAQRELGEFGRARASLREAAELYTLMEKPKEAAEISEELAELPLE
jgi:tetratricopeptide (TPR) repeat protein/transcriptional regulator with XRE-family HTH domain